MTCKIFFFIDKLKAQYNWVFFNKKDFFFREMEVLSDCWKKRLEKHAVIVENIMEKIEIF